MNHETIKRIDYFVGRPLCALCTLWRRLRDRVCPQPYTVPRSVLFIKLIEQGATVSAYGALKRAVDTLGPENVHFLVFEQNREILDLLDLVPDQNIHTVRSDSFGVFSVQLGKALWALRRVRVEAAVDMEFYSRASALIAWLSGARWRAGLHRFRAEGPYRGDLMTHRIQHSPYMNVAHHYLSLVEAVLRAPGDEPMPKVPVKRIIPDQPAFKPARGEEAALAEKLGLPPRDQGPIVVLNPNAHDSLSQRKWPETNFAALARRIAEKWPTASFVITGTEGERPGVEAMCAALEGLQLLNVAGRTTLRELLVLYGVADVLVTNDSGPGHFASMTPINTIVLFGPETPAVFSPLGPRVRTLYAGLACSPCVTPLNHRFSPCQNNICMASIEVEEVLAAVAEALSQQDCH